MNKTFCTGTTIETFTGIVFDPLNPEAADVDLVDIAHALSMKCRYTGHCREFYSVAQHSVLMARNSSYGLAAPWALFHDASEAYLPDIARPIKDEAFPNFREIEARVLEAVAEALGLPWPIPVHIDAHVKALDNGALITEASELMPSAGKGWKDVVGVIPLPPIGEYWTPSQAQNAFMFEAGTLLVGTPS